MWSEKFTAVPKQVKFTSDEAKGKICILTLQMVFDKILSYGLPHGRELVEYLEAREVDSVQMRLDGEPYHVSLTSQATGEVTTLKGVTFGKVVLSAKEDKTTGDLDFFLKLELVFQWENEQALFVIDNVQSRLEVQSARAQLELPIRGSKPSRLDDLNSRLAEVVGLNPLRFNPVEGLDA